MWSTDSYLRITIYRFVGSVCAPKNAIDAKLVSVVVNFFLGRRSRVMVMSEHLLKGYVQASNVKLAIVDTSHFVVR